MAPLNPNALPFYIPTTIEYLPPFPVQPPSPSPSSLPLYEFYGVPPTPVQIFYKQSPNETTFIWSSSHLDPYCFGLPCTVDTSYPKAAMGFFTTSVKSTPYLMTPPLSKTPEKASSVTLVEEGNNIESSEKAVEGVEKKAVERRDGRPVSGRSGSRRRFLRPRRGWRGFACNINQGESKRRSESNKGSCWFINKSVAPGNEFDFKDGVSEEDAVKTTVMMRNLPNKMSKSQLIELLDKHCQQENQKDCGGNRDGSNTQKVALSEYDFLYLPMDFSSGSNLGYAFINFASASAARRLHSAYHKKSWDRLLGSRKVCEVTYARIQGREELLEHFKNSTFYCDNNEYLPVSFSPNRDGSRQVEQQYIGRRVARSPEASAAAAS